MLFKNFRVENSKKSVLKISMLKNTNNVSVSKIIGGINKNICSQFLR